MKYYSAKKRNAVEIHVPAWMNLENTMLSRSSQTQRITDCMIPFIWKIQNRQIHRDWKYNSGCLELQGNRWIKVMVKGCGSGFFEVMKTFWNWLWWWLHNSDYTKNYWIVHFKRVTCLVCELYLNKMFKKKNQRRSSWHLGGPKVNLQVWSYSSLKWWWLT